MPHVELPKATFVREMLAAKRSTYMDLNGSTYFHDRVAPPIAMEHMVEYLNCGTQKVVFAHPDDSSKVVTAEYWNSSPTLHKQTYYLHNVFNSLWPHNIPHIFAAGKTTDVKPIAWSIRQRIVASETDGVKGKIKYPFSSVMAESKRFGISISHDPHPSNYIAGVDGGEYYVDNLDFWGYLPLNAISYLAEMREFSPYERARLTTNVISFNQLANKRWENNSPAIK